MADRIYEFLGTTEELLEKDSSFSQSDKLFAGDIEPAIESEPVAADDVVGTNEDTPVTVQVRANDVDVDGDVLTVTANRVVGSAVEEGQVQELEVAEGIAVARSGVGWVPGTWTRAPEATGLLSLPWHWVCTSAVTGSWFSGTRCLLGP